MSDSSRLRAEGLAASGTKVPTNANYGAFAQLSRRIEGARAPELPLRIGLYERWIRVERVDHPVLADS